MDDRLLLDLASGDSRKVSSNVKIPSSLAAGMYTVQAEAKGGDPEYDDSNNKTKASVKIKVIENIPL